MAVIVSVTPQCPACTAIGILRAIRKMVMELHHVETGSCHHYGLTSHAVMPPVLADDTVYTALIWPSGSVYQSTVRTHSAAASVEA